MEITLSVVLNMFDRCEIKLLENIISYYLIVWHTVLAKVRVNSTVSVK